jgi:serine/threonine protein kinase
MTSKTSDLDGKTEISIMADSGLEKGRELTRGTCIDRYVILDKIGEGGMGIVYKAYDPELDRQIAVKLLIMKPCEGEDTTGHRSRLLREAQALAKLSHPNVVAVYDVGTFEGDAEKVAS